MVPEYGAPHFISCPIDLQGATARISVNAQGISPRNRLRATLLDERMRPIPGYTAEDCVPLASEGLQVPVRWRGGELVEGLSAPFMLRVDWDAERPEDVFLYAAYVTE